MNSTLFDLEHLQQLTYERSKTWSSFLEVNKTNLSETSQQFQQKNILLFSFCNSF